MVITEDYVSFNTAKLLKEKGFNEPCYTNYVENEISHYDYSSTNFELIDGIISAPTIQMARKWLEKTHGVCLNIIYNRICDKGYWDKGHWTWSGNEYDSYEQALETAIKYCLENLI